MYQLDSYIWDELLDRNDNLHCEMIYKRLDIDLPVYIRYAIIYPSRNRAMLVQFDMKEQEYEINFPDWKGLDIRKVLLDTPRVNTAHIVLELTHDELLGIFTILISDVIGSILNTRNSNEAYNEFEKCISRWDFFFRKCGPEGLSKESQRGLIGELFFLKKALEKVRDYDEIITSWKGCERGYHDFQREDTAVEIKTTMGVEPLKIIISNERQLDEKGLIFLFLGVYHLLHSRTEGVSLNSLVDEVYELLKGKGLAEIVFEQKLLRSGYLKIHKNHYNDLYIILNEYYYRIEEGFPRITDVPQGVGNLKYSIVLSACKDYEENSEKVMKNFLRRG